MISVEMEISPGLKKLLDPSHKKHVERVLKKSRDELGKQINIKIKQKGFAPRDTGKLAESHHVVSTAKETLIKTNRTARNGTPLWYYVVDGHRVLTTEKSRKWWFWYLKNVLGGSYTRKTSGPPGYVPPNRYHERAIAAVSFKSILSTLEQELLH
jgi:hypothetical protein